MKNVPAIYLEVKSSIVARPNNVAPITFKTIANLTEEEIIDKFTIGALEDETIDDTTTSI